MGKLSLRRTNNTDAQDDGIVGIAQRKRHLGVNEDVVGLFTAARNRANLGGTNTAQQESMSVCRPAGRASTHSLQNPTYRELLGDAQVLSVAIVVRAEHGGGVRQWGHWRPIVTIQRLPSIYLHERQQAHRHNGKVTTRKNHSVSSCENSIRTPMLFLRQQSRGVDLVELELEPRGKV